MCYIKILIKIETVSLQRNTEHHILYVFFISHFVDLLILRTMTGNYIGYLFLVAFYYREKTKKQKHSPQKYIITLGLRDPKGLHLV